MTTHQPEALHRAQRDASRGDLATARLRLGSYLSHDPDHRDVRAYLVDLCRKAGDPVEAGRWGYLTDDATDDERDRFEARYGGDQSLFMHHLNDSTRVSRPSDHARRRLGSPPELEPHQTRRVTPDDMGGSTSWGERAFALGCGLVVLWALFLALLGAWQVSQFVLH